jgi:phospholipase/carboxylesterase
VSRLGGVAVAIAIAVAPTACGRGDRSVPASPLVERTVPPRAAAPRPPLLVLLHGIGADERDLLPLADAVDPRFLVVSLRAPRPYHGGWAWFDLDFRPGGEVVPDAAGAADALATLVAWLNEAPGRLGTDPARTYLLGFSQGAMMAIGVLGTVPERLAGVVALSGREPARLFPLRAAPEAVARVPLLVAHGTHDDVLPVEHGRRTRDAFASLSRDFTYREFPVGHGISDDEVALVAGWLAARLDQASDSGASRK